jgi:hypothetical protein
MACVVVVRSVRGGEGAAAATTAAAATATAADDNDDNARGYRDFATINRDGGGRARITTPPPGGEQMRKWRKMALGGGTNWKRMPLTCRCY